MSVVINVVRVPSACVITTMLSALPLSWRMTLVCGSVVSPGLRRSSVPLSALVGPLVFGRMISLVGPVTIRMLWLLRMTLSVTGLVVSLARVLTRVLSISCLLLVMGLSGPYVWLLIASLLDPS